MDGREIVHPLVITSKHPVLTRLILYLDMQAKIIKRLVSEVGDCLTEITHLMIIISSLTS